MNKKLITVTAGVIYYQNKILIAQRRRDKSMGGLWEFPGGKIESGETCEQTLAREIREEFDINIQVGSYLMEHTYSYPTFDLKMFVYQADWDGQGTIRICDHEEYKFVTLDEMSAFEFTGADYPVIEYLKMQNKIAYDTRKLAVVFLIKQDQKYLFQKRTQTGFCDGYYMLPGGHVDQGETILHAATREISEELGIHVKESDLIFRLVHPSKSHVTFFFEVTRYTGTITNKEPTKHDHLCFLESTHPEIHPIVQHEIKTIEKNHCFIPDSD